MGHVNMMSAVQPFISGAISKTVNLPEEATVADIEDLHMEAWRLGLKAVAIYRDNCKVGQPLSTQKKAGDAAPAEVERIVETIIVQEPVRQRLPRKRTAKTFSFRVADCHGYVTVGEYEDGRPGEIWLQVAKQGSTLAGIMDAFPVRRGSVHPTEFETWAGYTPPANVGRYSTWGASGLTGVWAEENTRPSIYAGLRRKETFATTGPRIRVRFFAGFGLGQTVLGSEAGLRKAYADGVPMGGDLVGKAGASPDFLVWASRDPSSAPLQRLQIVKAWTDAGGKSYEKVFDVACSDGGRINSATQRCADNGATVDLKTCGISQDKGDAELSVSWKDPEFNTALNALYYVRVLENPTCRWSTWDALRAGQEPSPALEKTIQERAYTSPIWYTPPPTTAKASAKSDS